MSDLSIFRCPSCGGVNRIPSARLNDGPKCGRCKTALDISGAPQALDDAALDRLVRQATVPILVDFWAPWCGPCRAVAPHLDSLGRKHAGKLLIVKINTDEHKATAQRLNVRGIPTLAVWRNGNLEKSESGARMGAQLDAFVAPYL